ncbi:hypothetical protein GQ42DRAFT_179649 [Ramicandelaber brevisporus]|nr:hypothetical protein GQ42DRAFT_179649 [Ramicandelaber brevisporus]
MRRYNQQMQRQQQNQQQNQQQGQQVPQLNLQQSTDPLNPQQQQQNIQQQHQLNAEDEPMSIAVTAVPSAAPTSSSSFTASGFGRSSGGSVDLSAMSGAAISNRVRDEAEQRVITIMRRLALYPIVYFVLHISSVIQRLTSSAGLDVPALKFLVGLAQYHGFANAILYSLTGSLRHTIADGFARLVPTQVMRRLSTNAMRRRRQSQLQQQQHQQHQQQMEMSQSQLEPGHTSVDIDMDQYAVGINDVNSLSLEQSGIIKQPGRPQLQYQHQHQIQNADGGSIQLNDYDKIAKSHENLGEMDDYYDDWVSPELRSEPTVPTSTVPIARRSMSVSQFHQRRSSHHHQQFQRPQHPQHPQQMYHDQTTTGGRRDRVTEILEEEGVESNRRHPIRRSSSESVTSRAGSSHQQDNDQHSTSRKDSAAETQKHDHQA